MNSDPHDDLTTRQGHIVTSDTLFGNSWKVSLNRQNLIPVFKKTIKITSIIVELQTGNLSCADVEADEDPCTSVPTLAKFASEKCYILKVRDC